MGRRDDRRRNLAAVIGAVAMIGAGIGLVAIPGPDAPIPAPLPNGDTIRIDLLASRDLEVSGALPAGGTTDLLPPASAQTWTRTGGTSCYPISTTDASCFTSSEVPYTYAATTIDGVAYTLGWVTEPSATNRVLYNTAIDCTNWTCRGSSDATPLQAAPDGSATATIISVGASGTNDLYTPSSSGYTIGGTIYPCVWVKCSAGTLVIQNSRGPAYGSWSVVCSVASSGAWTLANGTRTGITLNSAWVADGGGRAGFWLFASSGTVTASIWAPTLTKEPGTGLAVIPTGAAAVSTGDPAWTIDNASGAYYVAGDTVTQTLSEITGTCWVVSGTDLLLSGASGSECSGIWYGLNVTK